MRSVILFLLLATVAGATIGLYMISQPTEPPIAGMLTREVKCAIITSQADVAPFRAGPWLFREVQSWAELNKELGSIAEATPAFQQEQTRNAIKKAGILRIFLVSRVETRAAVFPIYVVVVPHDPNDDECRMHLLDYNLGVDSYPPYWGDWVKELDPLFISSRR